MQLAESPHFILAIDHRKWFEDQPGATPGIISEFKAAVVRAALESLPPADVSQVGFILDHQYGGAAMTAASQRRVWTAEPVEQSGVFPLALLDAPRRWLEQRPADRITKVLVFDPDEGQARVLQSLQDACEQLGRRYLLEVVVRKGDLGQSVDFLSQSGLRPHWWKVAAGPGLARVQAAAESSAHCRGVLLLGGGESIEALHAGWAALSGPVAGCAVGRSLFGDPFLAHLAGLPLPEAAGQVAQNFRKLRAGFPLPVGRQTG
ncbi:MAG TPA: DUF2090 domain-containing protein [Candidatus Xenobia bacterium]|jgi:myo-inositol catabolism protein IolC